MLLLEGNREMAEDLTKMWGNFSLSEEEGLEMEINNHSLVEVVNRGQSCLVGKLLSDRMLSKEIIRSKLIRGWRPIGTLSFKILGDNLFLVEFENSWDKIRVLERRPWVFEGSLFAVEDFDRVTPPFEIDFKKVVFWVRKINLPLAFMSKDISYQIGSSVGIVKEVDIDEERVGLGEYLQVKIQLDLKKPLSRGRMLKVQGRSVKVVFQYERLPRYCFQCCCIKHGKVGCQSRRGPQVRREVPQFGPWLRPISPARRRERDRDHHSGRGSMKGGVFHLILVGIIITALVESGGMIRILGGGATSSHERSGEELKSKGAKNSGGMSSIFSNGRDMMGDETVGVNQGDVGGFPGEDHVNNNTIGSTVAMKEMDCDHVGDSFIKELSGGGISKESKLQRVFVMDIERDLQDKDMSMSGNTCNMMQQTGSDSGEVGRSMVGMQGSSHVTSPKIGPMQDHSKCSQPVLK